MSDASDFAIVTAARWNGQQSLTKETGLLVLEGMIKPVEVEDSALGWIVVKSSGTAVRRVGWLLFLRSSSDPTGS